MERAFFVENRYVTLSLGLKQKHYVKRMTDKGKTDRQPKQST